MYTIVYMKADYEPWWQFEGWQQWIQTEETFETKEQFEAVLQQKLQHFRSIYQHEAVKEDKYWAFWSDNEMCYCDSCDDDVQIYHGIIAMQTTDLKEF
ncbi:hypothetical protein LYSBPC_22500 [Lysinibacillus piscis]|uniref:DUF1033 family protein n=1 Tax=Lysinibacillus piscis TaxID=2518931 RepID=A0ABQ5NLE6_9BACI|nr:hypothetical protein LYSBPC_22500 [Lysinibacillus sp. KH24]